MGGKREVRRCTSLMVDDTRRTLSEDVRKVSEDIVKRAASLTKTDPSFVCPKIHVDVCNTDDEEHNDVNNDANNNYDRRHSGSGKSLHGELVVTEKTHTTTTNEEPQKHHVTFVLPNEHEDSDHATSLSANEQFLLGRVSDLPSFGVDKGLLGLSRNASVPSTLNIAETNCHSNTFKTTFLFSPATVKRLQNSPPTSQRAGPMSPTLSRHSPMSSTTSRHSPMSPTTSRHSPLSPTTSRHSPMSPTPPLLSSKFLEVPGECHLSLVKKATVRLNLRTRSSSFMEWRSKWLETPLTPPELSVLPPEADVTGVERGDKLTAERKERINSALHWLKTELREMQSADQHLARQLLSLRHDIHQLRLRKSCQLHRDLLDDVQSELEEQEELSDVLDLPQQVILNDTPLKQLGVTRMNLSARRFSTC